MFDYPTAESNRIHYSANQDVGLVQEFLNSALFRIRRKSLISPTSAMTRHGTAESDFLVRFAYWIPFSKIA
jgi:hypothetical protein